MAIIFFSTFIRRKNRLVLERFEAEQKFEKELTNSRLEIQEQTFKNIAWELHDNVGQLLSVANMQLNMLSGAVAESHQEQLNETKGVVTESLKEIRNLSRGLNKDVVLNNGLVASVETEMQRFNRMNFLEAKLQVDGQECCINSKDEIIIFRILQEFFSNVIKHAKANNLFVNLSFQPNKLVVSAKDDGIGFDLVQVKANAGLLNMKSRAAIINSTLEIKSKEAGGVLLTLEYPYKENDQTN
ncbi:MAG: histidine kinase [Gilvibacter sp.]